MCIVDCAGFVSLCTYPCVPFDHAQSLMELVLALKKCLARWGALEPSVSVGRSLTSRDATYIQGREGPQLCSLVSPTYRTVLGTMNVVAGA